MGRLKDHVAEAVRDQGLWRAGQRVAVAVSGGLDSVVLLQVLRATAGRHGGELSVVTIDHGTRPGSSRDADFVQALAGSWDLPCTRHRLDLGEHASEAACREARYAVLDGLEVDRVALAHHRDDQAETVLLRLLRGSGTRGLGGMAWRRGRYVRPLLRVPRAVLCEHADQHGLSWTEDPTNRDPRFLRNRIRHELLPLLEDLRPGAASTLARSATLSAEDDALLADLSRQHVPVEEGRLRVQHLRAAPGPLARRAVLRLAPGASAAQIDAILAAADRGTGCVHLSATARVHIDKESVCMLPDP